MTIYVRCRECERRYFPDHGETLCESCKGGVVPLAAGIVSLGDAAGERSLDQTRREMGKLVIEIGPSAAAACVAELAAALPSKLQHNLVGHLITEEGDLLPDDNPLRGRIRAQGNDAVTYGLALVLAQALPTQHRRDLILGLTREHCFVRTSPAT